MNRGNSRNSFMSGNNEACKPTLKRFRSDPNMHYLLPRTGPMPTSLPTIPCVRQRICLLWAKHPTSPIRLLSLNVLREIASFIDYIPKAVNLRNRKVIAIGPLEREWTGLYEVGLEITGLFCSLPLSEDRLFVGLIECRKLPDRISPKACFHIYQNSIPWKLCYRAIIVWNSGLIYDSRLSDVYFFGGTDVSGSAVSTSIKLSIQTQTWTEIPASMHCSRCDFNPCWYQRLIYLCSGNDIRVETYDPVASTFKIYEPFSLPAVVHLSLSISVVIGDELIFMAKDTVFGYHFKTGKTRKDTQVVPNFSIKSPPLVYCGIIYCVDCGRNQMWELRPFGISESHPLEFFF